MALMMPVVSSKFRPEALATAPAVEKAFAIRSASTAVVAPILLQESKILIVSEAGMLNCLEVDVRDSTALLRVSVETFVARIATRDSPMIAEAFLPMLAYICMAEALSMTDTPNSLPICLAASDTTLMSPLRGFITLRILLICSS